MLLISLQQYKCTFYKCLILRRNKCSGNVIFGCDQVSGPCVTSKAGGVFSIHNASEGSYTLYVYWRNQTCSTGVTVTRQSVVDVGELRVTLRLTISPPDCFPISTSTGPGESILIQTVDGNRFRYSMEEIERMVKEPRTDQRTSHDQCLHRRSWTSS